MLVECHGMLVAGLDAVVTTLNVTCYSKSLISEDTHKDILQLNLSSRDKVTRFLLNVKQTIERKREMFEEFIIALDELTCCDHLVQELMRKKALLLEVSCVILAEPCAWSYLCSVVSMK